MDNITKSHIRQIKQAMRQNKLVIFAGAGVSKSAGVPLWGELIDELKKELDLQQYETDFLKIPQLYKNLRKGKEYLERIREILKEGCVQPNKIHEAILELKPCHIVTTNYDDLFEQAIANSNCSFFTVSKDEDLPFNRGEKLLIKMHGDFKSGNIVLTENDYLDYEKNFPLIRSYLMSIFASKLVLFVGFSFSDINLKYILRDVRNCLGEKMQPVYMLSSGENNVHMINYFDNNLVNIVRIEGAVNDTDLKGIGLPLGNTLFDDEKSQILYNQLICLEKYNESQNDFFSLFENFLDENIEQFHQLGKYIKYIFPSELQRESYLNDGVLHIPSAYTNSAKKLFEDSENAKAFREKNKDRLHKLMVWLNANDVDEIESVVNVRDYLDKEGHNQEKDELSYIYDLDMKKVATILEERGNKPLRYNKEDLMYPYMLCLLGRYKEAYDCYKRLYSLMVAKKKFILAFICRYNMRSLYGPVMNETSNWSKEMWLSLNKEISRIDVRDALANMPIDGPLRIVLSDLSNGKYFADRLVDSNDYKQKLRSQYEDSLKGGTSINSNILHILWIADEIVDFDHNNYIFNEPFANYRSIFLNIVEGIFYSVLTKEGDFGSSKLKCLYDGVADILFYLQPNDFRDLLNKNVGKQTLPVNDSFKNRIKQWLDNLYEISENGRYKQTIFSRARIGELILNILWLSLYSEPKLDLPNIYSLIKEYWFDGRMMACDKLLNQFCLKYEATAKEAMGILENILHSNIGYTRSLGYAVANLCGCMEKANEKLEELISVKMIQNTDNIQYIASFCRVATDDVKEEIIGYLRDNVKSLYQLVEAEKYSNNLVMNPELLRKLKNTFFTKNDNILFAEEYVCSNLIWIYDKCRDEQLKEAINECISTNRCYQFMRNPEIYEGNISEIPGSWYLYVEDEVLKRLLRNPLAVRNIKEFCEKNPWYVEFKEKIWNLL